MTQPELILLVKFKSPLSLVEIEEIAESRIDSFRGLRGLKQKYYLHDPQTGEYGGLYLWESAGAFEAYRESELRASIAAAYQVEGEPRIEILNVFRALRDEMP